MSSILESNLYRSIPIAAVDVPLPSAGNFYQFLDSSNDNLLSKKDSSGVVSVVELTDDQLTAIDSIGDILTILNSI